jgi:hypothetical protein
MLPTDADLAALCAGVYGYAGAPVTPWDHFDTGFDDGVCWALKRLSGYDVVVLRGSVLFYKSKIVPDWIRDVRARPILTRIGHVHEGFFEGMERMLAELRPLIQQPVVITGHSLGAARASHLTALMVKDGAPPVLRVVFGEPKPGFQDHAEIVATVPGRSYRNGDDADYDRVTDEPLLPREYVRATPVIPVCSPPPQDDLDVAFRWHHMPLYCAAVSPQLVPVSV